MATVTVPAWAQGRSGRGQGGYTAARFEAAIGQSVSISLRAPIPLEAELAVVETSAGWELRDGDQVIMGAALSDVTFGATKAVPADLAGQARTRFAGHVEHAAPECVSCGLADRSMRVWAGPLDDGTNRFATDWIPPTWAGDDSGIVHRHFVWMALDCTSGFFVAGGSGERNAVTAQFAAEVIEPIRVGETYVAVGFDGRWVGDWDGRKRGAGAAVFDVDGQLVAQADSFWIAVE